MPRVRNQDHDSCGCKDVVARFEDRIKQLEDKYSEIQRKHESQLNQIQESTKRQADMINHGSYVINGPV